MIASVISADHKTLMIGGSGPSYGLWPHWPTWSKLVPMLYKCKVIDAAAPAAGNKYIYRSIVTRSQDIRPDLVLVQWNLGKFDIYVDNQEFADEITQSASIRNFLLDIHTSKTTTGAGYWCSSVDNIVPWKKYYNEKIKSRRGTAVDDLDAMLSLQNFCEKKKFPYFFFTHDDVDHPYLSCDPHTKPFYDEIEWERQVFDPVRSLYKSHDSYRYDLSGIVPEYHWVPNAYWQSWFADQVIKGVLGSVGISTKTDKHKDMILKYCYEKTLEIYAKAKS